MSPPREPVPPVSGAFLVGVLFGMILMLSGVRAQADTFTFNFVTDNAHFADASTPYTDYLYKHDYACQAVSDLGVTYAYGLLFDETYPVTSTTGTSSACTVSMTGNADQVVAFEARTWDCGSGVEVTDGSYTANCDGSSSANGELPSIGEETTEGGGDDDPPDDDEEEVDLSGLAIPIVCGFAVLLLGVGWFAGASDGRGV